MYLSMYVRTYVRMYVCICVCVCIYIYMCVCVYVCMYRIDSVMLALKDRHAPPHSNSQSLRPDVTASAAFAAAACRSSAGEMGVPV